MLECRKESLAGGVFFHVAANGHSPRTIMTVRHDLHAINVHSLRKVAALQIHVTIYLIYLFIYLLILCMQQTGLELIMNVQVSPLHGQVHAYWRSVVPSRVDGLVGGG